MDGCHFSGQRTYSPAAFWIPRYEQLTELQICLTVTRLTRRSLTISYEFRREIVLLAVGEMKTAYCTIPNGAKLESVEMPDSYFDPLSRLRS